MTYDLIIVGAGAAGLFAAAHAPAGQSTLVLEKTAAPGNKLRLTGSGQCNLTNDSPIRSFLDHYGPNGKRLRPVLFPFSNVALMEYFTTHGLPLTTRPDGKVFPQSQKSDDVIGFLLTRARARGATFRFHAEVSGIAPVAGGGFRLSTAGEDFLARRVLIATGGASFPRTGSDGRFFTCLETLGVPLIPHRPALAPLFVADYPYGSLAGVSVPHTSLTVGSHKAGGSLLFTHTGLSGPVVLTLSRYASIGNPLTINYLPRQDAKSLRQALLHASSGSKQELITVLERTTHLPRRLLAALCARAGLSPTQKAAQRTGNEMGTLSAHLVSDAFCITNTGDFSVAMTTAGGVSLDAIDLSTMQSRDYPGLYFAGEVVDVDGDTGGYNLQFAFSSAKACMSAMAD